MATIGDGCTEDEAMSGGRPGSRVGRVGRTEGGRPEVGIPGTCTALLGKLGDRTVVSVSNSLGISIKPRGNENTERLAIAGISFIANF